MNPSLLEASFKFAFLAVLFLSYLHAGFHK
jgi:hypothetical protein